ncbi:MAG: hypothetical protein J6M16_06055 [Clostridia bacterium]|nr:hypothetical protein [Clostridia bacterium]
MAMIKCGNCGKEISDIYDNCPYCKNPLHQSSSKSEINDVSNDDLTENLILTGYGAFLSLLALLLFNTLSNIYGGRYLGDVYMAAGVTAWSAFFFINIAVLFIGAIAHTFLPLLIKNFSSLPDFVIHSIITVIMAVIHTAVIVIFKSPILVAYNTPPAVIDIAASLTIYYGIAVSFIQGAMIISGKNHSPILGVLFELLPFIVFILAGFLLMPLFIFALALGVTGIVWAGIIAVLLAFGAAIVKSLFITGF